MKPCVTKRMSTTATTIGHSSTGGTIAAYQASNPSPFNCKNGQRLHRMIDP